MTELSKIQELVDEELKEANEKYPLFHSYHEAYKEWEDIKRDEVNKSSFAFIKYHALNAAAEAIQIAAMCDKERMKKEQETFLHGWIKCKDPSELTPENICRFCATGPDECGEYPDICYKGVMKELK